MYGYICSQLDCKYSGEIQALQSTMKVHIRNLRVVALNTNELLNGRNGSRHTYVSFLSLWQSTCENQFKEEKPPFSSRFQRFPSTVSWPHCFGPAVMLNTTAENTQWNEAAHFMAAGTAKDSERANKTHPSSSLHWLPPTRLPFRDVPSLPTAPPTEDQVFNTWAFGRVNIQTITTTFCKTLNNPRNVSKFFNDNQGSKQK